MKKFLAFVFAIAFIIVIFNFNRSEIGDFYDVRNAGADKYIKRPYVSIPHHNSQDGYQTTYVPTLTGSTVPFRLEPGYMILSSNELIYYVYFVGTSEGSMPLYLYEYTSQNLLYIPFTYEFCNVAVFARTTGLGNELADKSFWSNDITSEQLISSDGFQIVPIIVHGESNLSSYDGESIQLQLEDAYYHFVNEINLMYVYNKSIALPPLGSVTSAITYNFPQVYNLVDTSSLDGSFWLKSLVYRVNELGDMPSLPDVEFTEEPIDFIASYFVWVIDEIIWLFKFVSVFLGVVF